MAEVNIDVAKQATSEEINNKLGLTSDTGGSEIGGTVMSKLNALIEVLRGLDSYSRNYLGSFKIEASDELYLESGIEYEWKKSISGNINLDLPMKIKFDAAGDATLTYNFYRDGLDATGSFLIYMNGTLIKTVSLAYGLSSPTLSYALSGVRAGDIISFHVTTSTSYNNSVIKLNSVNVLATPVDARTLDLIKVINE